MAEFLIGFCYHEPEPFRLWNEGAIEDYESSTAIFVAAETMETALAWAKQVAEALHRRENGDPNLDWNGEYHAWHEGEPNSSSWGHALPFFQHVEVGEWPDMSRMGTNAYVKWANANGFRL